MAMREKVDPALVGVCTNVSAARIVRMFVSFIIFTKSEYAASSMVGGARRFLVCFRESCCHCAIASVYKTVRE